MGEREAVLMRAESDLARGDPAAAVESFDRAALMLHAPDAEMGLVRAYMQGGEYRHALAFCAHAAGAHLEAPEAGALYVWLLRAGGQQAYADRLLGELVARAPSNRIVQGTRRAFAMPWPLAEGELLETPHRMAPQDAMESGQAPVAKGASVVASGVLIDQGRRALMPASSLGWPLPRRFWVRNGLGQTREARLDASEPSLDRLGVTLLRLSSPLAMSVYYMQAPRDPFAGSPGFAIEYTTSNNAAPAWPWLRQGFFGPTSNGDAGSRRLGIDLPDGAHGGPVLDANGRLAGIALPGRDQRPMLLPVSSWARIGNTGSERLPATTQGGVPLPVGRVMPADEAYEHALRLALQVIAAP